MGRYDVCVWPITLCRAIQIFRKMNSDEKIRRKMASIIDENTLIIIDEAHKFRTEGIDGTENLRSLPINLGR